jgi:hypothetical protein
MHLIRVFVEVSPFPLYGKFERKVTLNPKITTFEMMMKWLEETQWCKFTLRRIVVKQLINKKEEISSRELTDTFEGIRNKSLIIFEAEPKQLKVENIESSDEEKL